MINLLSNDIHHPALTRRSVPPLPFWLYRPDDGYFKSIANFQSKWKISVWPRRFPAQLGPSILQLTGTKENQSEQEQSVWVAWLIWFNLTKCPRYWRIPDSLSITQPDQFNNDVGLTKQTEHRAGVFSFWNEIFIIFFARIHQCHLIIEPFLTLFARSLRGCFEDWEVVWQTSVTFKGLSDCFLCPGHSGYFMQNKDLLKRLIYFQPRNIKTWTSDYN